MNALNFETSLAPLGLTLFILLFIPITRRFISTSPLKYFTYLALMKL